MKNINHWSHWDYKRTWHRIPGPLWMVPIWRLLIKITYKRRYKESTIIPFMERFCPVSDWLIELDLED